MESLTDFKDKTDEELFLMYQTTKSQDIKQELTLRYMYLAKAIAIEMHTCYSHFMQTEDVINEGAIAIMKGIDRFEPEKGIKFSTFISRRIKGMVYDLVREKDMMPRTYGKRKQALEDAVKEFQKEQNRMPSDEELAEFMQMNLKRCKTLLSQVRLYESVSLDETVDNEGEQVVLQLASDDPTVQPEENYIRHETVNILERAIDQLKDNLKLVISLYYVEGLAMHEIAEVLGVSDSRVSQMHKTAIQKLRGLIKEDLE